MDRPEPAAAPPPPPTLPRRRLVLIALMCLVLGGLGGLLAAAVKPATPVAARFIPVTEQAYDFALRDEQGTRRSIAGARGDVVVLTFVYATCRDLCPAEGNDIAAALRQLPRSRVVAYMVSVDPIGDTPQRVRRWLEFRGLDGGRGHYLIGSRAELAPVWRHYAIAPINATRAEALAAAAGADHFYAAYEKHPFKLGPYQPPPSPSTTPAGAGAPNPDPADLAYRGRARHIAGWDFEHSGYVLLIDPTGRQRIGIPFESLSPEGLVRDIRLLLDEA